MILRQYLDTSPVVAASYLFGCGGKGVGAVVDPTEDIERYLVDSESLALPIRHVIDTHAHADHLSGARRLAEAAGAEYVLFEGVEARYPFQGVREGDVLALGNVSARVLHTPGHTPEHITLVVTDHVRAEEPWFALTGHTLMVGDMGRTELASEVEQGARDLYRSARKLRALPDHVEVLPGAFSGSVCGRGLSGKTTSTIGFERRFNKAFSITDEGDFVSLMLREIPPAPVDAGEIRSENLGIGRTAEV
jgi:glyoxylase-like metal-dependent hydrolase (beta-lactamase superfamily II)